MRTRACVHGDSGTLSKLQANKAIFDYLCVMLVVKG